MVEKKTVNVQRWENPYFLFKQEFYDDGSYEIYVTTPKKCVDIKPT